MRVQTKYQRRRPKNFTQKEKQDYCIQWELSGKSKAAFCQSVGITKSAFYSWYRQFGRNSDPVFSPVALQPTSTLDTEDKMQLEICLPSQAKVSISIQKSKVISFIQELSHATSVVQ